MLLPARRATPAEAPPGRATRPIHLVALGLALAAAACTEGAAPPGPTVRVSWAGVTGPHAGLPPDVDGLTVRVLDPGGDPPERQQDLTREEVTDDTPYAVIGDLPVERAVEVRIEARVGARVAYTGVVGPLVLGPGERRYVDILLVPSNAVTEMARAPVPVAFATGTRLGDGRVLFAGGFQVAAEVGCVGQPAGSRCFDLTATAAGTLYDPATGAVLATRNSMSSPRAAHTATLLDDGRVLLSGGVSAAQLVLVAQPDGDSFLPVLSVDGSTLSSTDLFDPTQFADDDDPEADGDPGRGGFGGGPEMTNARALHTATLLPSGDAVLVAGGGGAEQTSELFQGEAWTDGGALAIGRRGHVAFAVADPPAVWLVGGAIGAGAEADVAEIFTADGAGGTWGPPPALDLPVAGPTGAAGLNLVGAGVAVLAEHVAVVVGWTGPVCDDGGEPAWTGSPCAPDNLSFALDASDGRVAQPVGRMNERHAFGAVVPTPDGGAFAIGGFSDLIPSATGVVQRFTGIVDTGTLDPEVDAAVSLGLADARAMLAGAAQSDGTVVVLGGLSIEPAGVVVSDRVEVVSPPR